ncbi:tetratricopeptide repeat protein [Paracerasibacillus soli]|uniref:Tetratricopeptide repeat protein n=1 Tax=Paracerasibacillus soli TaxID=480284 RepID=A0ABU5CRF7_9BACI|nr:tetratricopeptide repeat protein [Virgibacillus soli]MDY0408023.1 tetratricopeptide repeat protein [Virgibacillus soli]
MLEIINIDKALTKVLEKHNFEGLSILREEFKRGHYPNVVAKIGDFRKQNKVGLDVEHLLCYMEAISYAEMKEYISSKEIIQKQYEQRTNATSDELIILGQIAFLSDHKLCRRIMSKVVMMCEREGANEIKLARCYMILGEAEENLDKFIRANKYYKKALKHFDNLAEDKYQLILHFKIGQNYAKVNEVEEAIAYLTKARAIAEQKKNIMCCFIVRLVLRNYTHWKKINSLFTTC